MTVELQKLPWEHVPYPNSFGTKEEAESDVNAVAWIKWTFGFEAAEWRRMGKKLKIVRSLVNGLIGVTKSEILWDSGIRNGEVDGTHGDLVMRGH